MEESIRNLLSNIEIFYRRKWIILLSVVVCTVGAAIISLNLPTSYKSSTMILVEQQQVPERYVTPTDKTPFSERLNTISQQIMSRTKLEQVINDLNLMGEYTTEIKESPARRILNMVGIQTPKSSMKEEIIEHMRSNIDVKVIGRGKGGGGDAFSISFVGRDPFVTMQVTNTLASLFIAENLKVREQYAEGTSNFISTELENAKKSLEAQEQSVRDFKEKYMGSLPQQLDANLRTLDRLQLELQSVSIALKNAQDRAVLLEDQLAPYSSVTGDPLKNPTINSLNVKLASLNTELANLRSIYKESYPDIVMAKNRIAEIENQLEQARLEALNAPAEKPAAGTNVINSETYNALKGVRSEMASLKARKAEIAKQIKLYEKRVEDTPANEQRLADLRRDYDISLKNYQALLEKKLSARLAENLEKRQKGERFRIMDPAYLPESPFKPNKSRITLMGLFVGLGLGGGLAYLLEFWNPAFRRAEDFIGVLDIPVLTVIPNFSQETK